MKRATLRPPVLSANPLAWKALRAATYRLLRRHGASLGVPLAVGAALRLIWLDDALFFYDQADTLALGRSAISHHAFILTGIISSIAALNPPIAAWVYAPFALLGSQGPFGATLLTALLNVLAIVLLYAIATRFGGRLAGCVAAFLYGTASGSVHYSRFIWQQNLLAPFLLLLLAAVLAGLIDHRASWLSWAALVWGIAVQLHSTAGALLAVIMFAALMTWRKLRLRDVMWAAAALAVLFCPALVWELVSHGSDRESYYLLATLTPVYDIAAPHQYAALISPAPPDWYGAGSSYTAVGAALAFLGPVIQILALASGVWLAAITVTPWISGRRAPGGVRASLASARWRLAATLLIWQIVPVFALIRHPVGIPEHYLLLLAPIIYLSTGLWAAATARAIGQKLARRWASIAPLAPVGCVALTVALALAQTVGVAAELVTVHSGQFSGTAFPLSYGIPLSSLDSTLAAATRSATAQRAHLAIASTEVEQDAYAYLAQTRATPATVYISDGCLITPARASGQPLVTLALPGTQAASLLPLLSGARGLGTLRAQGSAPLALYLTPPGAGLRNEVALPALATAIGPYPAAYSYGALGAERAYLAVRWSGAPTFRERLTQRPIYWFGSTASGPLVANYTVTAQLLGGAGQPIGAPLTARCDRLPWQAGTDLLAWLPLPGAALAAAATWSVSLSAAPVQAFNPTIGPLTLETADVTFSTPRIIAGPFTLATHSSA
ncbi:MAG TPA: glycosyltransferase family 39 protein [Ktedonobacterales bacterium]